MSGQHDDELTHPLEQVTGEKDVTPEEEEAERRRDGAHADDGTDGTGGSNGKQDADMAGTADAPTEVPD